jgi:2-methylcitrate dehydratase PrpD
MNDAAAGAAAGGAAASVSAGVTASVAAFLAGAARRALPRAVAEKTRHHLLDSLAAAVSGARLRAGTSALRYVRALGGARQATVIGSRLVTSSVNAALANGMSAHADETDDSHAPSLTHPGCAVVPAALALAEACGASGRSFLRAVAAGYDVGCRVTMAFDAYRLFEAGRGTHAIGGVFGAAAAAAVVAGLDARGCAHALSYAAQQASGITTWTRDRDHVEKAFVFGGMPARDGVTAATMVASGMSAVDDVLAQDGFFARFAPDGDARAMRAGLGTHHEIARAAIKKWSVGSPIQAPLDALEALGATQPIAPESVAAITVQIPEEAVKVVDGRAMPDVNLQHLMALYLVDGGLSFAASHDHARMADPAVQALRARVRLVGSRALSEARPRRQAIVEIALADGRTLSHRTVAVRGTPENPMTRKEVEAKALDLMAPVLGPARAKELVAAIRGIERLESCAALRPLLQA